MRIAELLADREALAALEADKAAAEAHKQRLMHELDSEARRVRDRDALCTPCQQVRADRRASTQYACPVRTRIMTRAVLLTDDCRRSAPCTSLRPRQRSTSQQLGTAECSAASSALLLCAAVHHLRRLQFIT